MARAGPARRGVRRLYSFDGTGWLQAGIATVPGQAATQDAGLFVTSHTAGEPALATFSGFTVTGTARAPSAAIADQAAAPGNTLAGGAGLQPCPGCYGGQRSLNVGNGATLTFNVTVPAAGTYNVTIVYCDGTPGAAGRQADVSANGGPQQLLTFTPTGSFTTIGARTVRLHLQAGPNTIELGNPASWTPDFNEIIIG